MSSSHATSSTDLKTLFASTNVEDLAQAIIDYYESNKLISETRSWMKEERRRIKALQKEVHMRTTLISILQDCVTAAKPLEEYTEKKGDEAALKSNRGHITDLQANIKKASDELVEEKKLLDPAVANFKQFVPIKDFLLASCLSAQQERRRVRMALSEGDTSHGTEVVALPRSNLRSPSDYELFYSVLEVDGQLVDGYPTPETGSNPESLVVVTKPMLYCFESSAKTLLLWEGRIIPCKLLVFRNFHQHDRESEPPKHLAIFPSTSIRLSFVVGETDLPTVDIDLEIDANLNIKGDMTKSSKLNLEGHYLNEALTFLQLRDKVSLAADNDDDSYYDEYDSSIY